MDFKYLKTKKINAALWVEIHNPPVNFLTVDILEELFRLVRQVEKDPSIRVFILTGGIEDSYIMHFSIPELVRVSADNEKIMANRIFRTRLGSAVFKGFTSITMRLMDRFPWYETLVLRLLRSLKGFSFTLFLWFQMHRLYLAIERMGKITIAAINGPCNGGGMEISLCFDFRFIVSDQDFTIGQPEVLLGILPGGGGSQRLPRLVGRVKALEIMLKADQVTVGEAKTLGLVTESFRKDEFRAKVQEFADKMSRRIPVAVEGIKNAVNRGLETDFLRALTIEMEESIHCFDSPVTQRIMQEYARFIGQHIEVPKEQRATVSDVVSMLQSDEFLRKTGG